MTDLSIVMITRNKERELPLILRSLFLQRNDVPDWELIIVDDGSDDRSTAVAERYIETLPLRIFRLPHGGNRNAVRNFGIEKTGGKRVVLLDGDICPKRTFLLSHNRYGDSDTVVLGERLKMHKPLDEHQVGVLLEKNNVFCLETMDIFADERTPYLVDLPIEKQSCRWRFLHSHNVSVPRAALVEAGGFDPALRFWGGDDLELGYRLDMKGLAFRFDPDCGGVHLYHDESRTDGYERNLTLFFRKYRDPGIELLFIEWELNAAECNIAYGNCTRQECTITVHAGKQLKPFGLLPDNTILDCINPADDNGYAIVDGLGVFPDVVTSMHEFAVMSPLLMKMGMPVFVAILENLQRSARQVMILDPDRTLEQPLERISRHNDHRVFTFADGFWLYSVENPPVRINAVFYMNSADDPTWQNADFESLIRALNRTGAVSAELICDIDRSLHSSAETAALRSRTKPMSRLLHDSEQTYVFPEHFLLENMQFFKHARSVFFDLYWYRDFDTIAQQYDVAVFDSQRKADTMLQTTRTSKTVSFIEPFYDPRLYHPVLKENSGAYRLGIIMSTFIEYISIADLLTHLPPTGEITLDIYSRPLDWVVMNSPYLSRSFNLRVQKHFNSTYALRHGEFAVLRERFADLAAQEKASFHEEDLTFDRIAAIMQHCDGMLCNDPHYVVRALACGADAIAPACFDEYSFTTLDNCHLVPGVPFSDFYRKAGLKPFSGTIDNSFEVWQHYHPDAVFAVIERCIEQRQATGNEIRPGCPERYSVDHAARRLADILKDDARRNL